MARIAFSIACVCLGAIAGAEKGFDKLQTLQGAWQKPLDHIQGKATVFVFIATDCPLSNAYAPELGRIYETFHARGVEFRSVYEDPGLDFKKARSHAKSFAYKFPGLIDPRHSLASELGAKVTPEAVVVSPTGRILYRGRIDNTFASVSRRRGVTTSKDLRDALDKTCKGELVVNSQTEAIGCAIPEKS